MSLLTASGILAGNNSFVNATTSSFPASSLNTNKKIKVKDVIDSILNYHPKIDSSEIDTLKFGDPEAFVKGIVTTCSPTVEVIRKTADLGYNMIISHEPAYYMHEDVTDYLEGDPVYEGKCKLMKDAGIALWRDHDHLHAHRPDGMYYGIMKELGWEKYCVNDLNRPRIFELPKMTVRDLSEFLKDKLDMNAVCVIGNMNAEISRVLYAGGGGVPMDGRDTKMVMENNIDVYIAGEMLDWCLTAYMRDAAMLGMNKAVIRLGHFNSEDLGMKYYPTWLRTLIPETIPVQFIRSGDPYRYVF